MKRLLIANRGEIALRIIRACADLGIASVAVYSEDDAEALHRARADEAAPLEGRGPAAYLDVEALVRAAARRDCDAVHPGYGFLAESPEFAQACGQAGRLFVGPSPATLALFGDKAAALAFARDNGVATPEGLAGGASVEQVRAFMAARPGRGVMIKAVAGGGGRGMRPVPAGEDPAPAMAAAAREAVAAFGAGEVYVEELLLRARHVEVQVAGDGARAVAVGERDCSLQRRRQKLIEIAPPRGLPKAVRDQLRSMSERLAEAARLKGLATFEFLVPLDGPDRAVFIECNPRLQVEHTVTEVQLGIDLVHWQLRLAAGQPLASLPTPRAETDQRPAVQLRVNLEVMGPDGQVRSGAGARIARYEPPTGKGVRVDGCGYTGYTPNPAFDSLLAKVVVEGDEDAPDALRARAERALADFVVEGAGTNLGFLRAVLERPEALSGAADVEFIEREMGALIARSLEIAPASPTARSLVPAPDGATTATAPLQGTLVSIAVAIGDSVAEGQTVAVLEAMKMHHLVAAPVGGRVVGIAPTLGTLVDEGAPVVFIEADGTSTTRGDEAEIDLESVRDDLLGLNARLALLTDAARPEAVDRRRKTGQRTARENLSDLFDGGAYTEYGGLAIAAQRRRRALDDLRRATPADGILTAVGQVNGDAFDEDRSRCAALAYDYTVLAGTQGHFSHKKTDRILELAERFELPVIWFTEGGGGRPGDVDVGALSASSLDTTSFTTFARMSGVAPRLAINSGRCFAGNAVFFGCADITIATRGSNIGLGGPAMIEGGGLGVFTPDEIGPTDVQWANGVIDLLVEDERTAAREARRLLGMFQGTVSAWSCADQRRLRHLVPENRVLAYDVRPIIEGLADVGSFIELRGGYGRGMITGFLRVEGRPLGLIANDPRHLGGAIDAEGAEKAGRFLQLCDAFDLPVLSLCDTPGFMVGPKSETTASVRRGSRLFVAAASLSTPLFAVVLRKGYGLGAQAMTGGDFSAAAFTIAWPTAEFGPMGLEGAVRLGYRKELEAEADPNRRQALFEKLVGRMYETGKAVSVAEVDEIDAVIDPKDTRAWIVQGLKSYRPKAGRRRGFVDVW